MRLSIIFVLMLFSFREASGSDHPLPADNREKSGSNRIGLMAEEVLPVFFPSVDGVNAWVEKNSIQWLRREGVLPLPHGEVVVSSELPAQRLGLYYQGSVYTFEQASDGRVEARVFASLYERPKMWLLIDGKKSSSIEITFEKRKGSKGHLIDYSCYGYELEVTGFDGEYLSIGCKKSVVGSVGNERVVVQALWQAPEWSGGGEPGTLNVSNLVGNGSAKINLSNEAGAKKTLSVKARVPKRRKRLLTALGLGPYDFTSTDGLQVYDDAISFMYMLYGKFVLNEKHSIKLFDAYIDATSTFNNFGVYFSSDFARLWDGRLVFNTLLGFQDLFFETPGSREHRIIYPQGLEMTFSHPFGLKNHKLMVGGFIGPGGNTDYSNVWVRYGKRVFWELNYLKWESGDSSAEAYGLSVGIPLFSAF